MRRRQISRVLQAYNDTRPRIDQSLLGRFIDNQDLTRFQTLIDTNHLPPTRLQCGGTLHPFACSDTHFVLSADNLGMFASA